MEPWLASVHFLTIFVLFALLLAEFVLLRLEPSGPGLKLLGRIDALYGIFAILVILSGLARVFWGDIPENHWLGNSLFWTKMALFGVIGGLSAIPTKRYLRWAKSFAAEGVLPEGSVVRKTAVWVHAQLGLFLLIPFAAVFMGR